MEAGPATMTNSSSSSSSSRSPPLGAKSASFRLHSPSFNTLHLRPYKSPTSMAERTQNPPSTSHRRSFSSEESRNRALIMEIAPATTTDSSSSSSSSRRPPLGAKSASFRLHSPSFNTLRLRRIFDLFDKNGDGLTTPEELSRALALHQSIHEAFFRGNDDDKAAAAAAAAAGGSPSSREKEYQCEAFKVIERQQLGKAVLNFAITMATGLLFNPYQRLTHLQACAVAIALSIGVATTWNGMLLHEFCPRVANALECFGACTIFLAFFGLVSSFLPPSLMWVCWLCGGLLFLPLVLPTAVERSAGRLDSGQATNVEIKCPTSLCGNELQITIEENNEGRSAQSSRRKGKEASQR